MLVTTVYSPVIVHGQDRLTSTPVLMELHSLAGEQVSPRSHDMSITPPGEDADADAAGEEVVVSPPTWDVCPGTSSYSLTYTCPNDINVNSRIRVVLSR